MSRPIKLRHGLRDAFLVAARDVHAVDRRNVHTVVGALLAEDPTGDALRGLVGSQTQDLDALREEAIGLLARGDLVAVKVGEAPRVLDAPRVEPLFVDPDGPGGEEPERPTWIEIEVRTDAGASLPGALLVLTLPSGETRSGRLDRTSHWRVDDIPKRGTCELEVFFETDPGGLPSAALQLRDDDVWLPPRRGAHVDLRTAAAHRIIVVTGRTEFAILDHEGSAVAGEPLAVDIGGRTIRGKTDGAGTFVVAHPKLVESCDVELQDVLPAAAQLTRSERL